MQGPDSMTGCGHGDCQSLAGGEGVGGWGSAEPEDSLGSSSSEVPLGFWSN